MTAGRILVAKPGLDGHDRGAKIVAQALRDAGFEVIYTGLRQRPTEIVATAVQEDVELIGLSILSGAHLELTARVMRSLEEAGASGIKVVVGGTIPDEDVPALLGAGVARVFTAGVPLDALVADIRSLLGKAPRPAAAPAPAPRATGTPPLAGVRVLDLTRYLAGPHGAQLLAQLGAEVIKVEPPERGDPMRTVSLYFQDGVAAHFVSGNAGKKSVTLDLHRPEGRRIFLQLVAKADVVMENYRPGTLARLGLDYPQLAAVNPRIVLGSVSGFGQTGPWRDWTSFDLVAQAVGGGMSLTGEPGRPPVKMGLAVGDLVAGVVAALGVVSALHRARETGRGAAVDVSMMDVQISLLSYLAHYYWASGRAPEPEGSGHPNIVPYRIFATPTGYLAVAVYGDHFWPGFCRALELPEVVADPRFATNEQRCAHREALEPLLAERLASKPREAWMARLAAEGVPAGPVHSVSEALASPQAQAREMVKRVKGPSGGELLLLGCPIKFSSGETAPTAPPALGQHTDQLLGQLLGYDEERLTSLRGAGVI
ncbi:MAG: CoA transferase [Candidatus Rokubacteria bacterium]|nr:CoA transferase [Candidatus Rokubacteria bacterium]